MGKTDFGNCQSTLKTLDFGRNLPEAAYILSMHASEGDKLGLYKDTRVIGSLKGRNSTIRRSGHMLNEDGQIPPLENKAKRGLDDSGCIQEVLLSILHVPSSV